MIQFNRPAVGNAIYIQHLIEGNKQLLLYRNLNRTDPPYYLPKNDSCPMDFVFSKTNNAFGYYVRCSILYRYNFTSMNMSSIFNINSSRITSAQEGSGYIIMNYYLISSNTTLRFMVINSSDLSIMSVKSSNLSNAYDCKTTHFD